MVFECFQCGECCAHLGLVHSIEKEYGYYRYRIHNKYTNEDTLVTVDPDKHALFDDKTIFEKIPLACPFFRYQPGSDLAFCTVHHTRPEICRDYQCWRLLILNPRGRRVGKIPHIRSLVSDDPLLNRIWEDCVEHHNEPDDRRWEDAMITTLTRAGYTVRR
ncbi:MAG: YkgJ family cysteine cluster protein [Methanoregula sp.]|nr:YkgJ family cysteine cluster protein [Methanoregula sp.]